MSTLLLLVRRPSAPRITRRHGLVQCDRRVIFDDTGTFHPLGVTLFWSLYGWKFERDRILAHLEWLQPKGFDYLRILCEVDWDDRTIDPKWPDYADVLGEFVDTAYDFGLRCELTIIGGRQYDNHDGHQRFVPTELAQQVSAAMTGREHKVMHYEMANEWDRLDKVTLDDVIAMAEVVVSHTPNRVALSRPKTRDDVEELRLLAETKNDEDSGYGAMKDATAEAGADAYTLHPRRSDADYGWAHVRQGYDFKDFPSAVWNNEPEGPQSSVESMDNPLQLACCRLLGIICGGAGYVLHVGQGVTGQADPEHGRPENMWDVPNIDNIMRIVRSVDGLVPLGIENWKCVNNARDDHPLPLDGTTGFWQGRAGRAPAVNKNYAALNGNDFVVILTGVKSVNDTGPVPAGTAIRACHVEAFDPVTLELVAATTLAAGQSWDLLGRHDTMAAYVIRGSYA